MLCIQEAYVLPGSRLGVDEVKGFPCSTESTRYRSILFGGVSFGQDFFVTISLALSYTRMSTGEEILLPLCFRRRKDQDINLALVFEDAGETLLITISQCNLENHSAIISNLKK